jgi:adenine-specific DNA-methyltransferase
LTTPKRLKPTDILATHRPPAVSRVRRDQFAAFYTPREVAQRITDWAVRDRMSPILDPSYGGCAFLEAALQSFQRMGCRRAGRLVFGVDLDPDARPSIDSLLRAGAARSQYRYDDFFSLTPESFPTAFQAIVGNPPYIKAHALSVDAKIRVGTRLKECGFALSARASYWAAFVLYSMRFLSDGGRLGLVLPGAVIHTAYAAQVRRVLAVHFQSITISLIEERLFPHTVEETAILFADGYTKAELREPTDVSVVTVCKAEQLMVPQVVAQVRRKVKRQLGPLEVKGSQSELLRSIAPAAAVASFDQAAARSDVVRLGDVARIRIGVVTGCNEFFVWSERARRELRLSKKHFVSILRRFPQRAGLAFEQADMKELQSSDAPTWLWAATGSVRSLPKSLIAHIREGEKQRFHLALKCRLRSPWYAVSVGAPPRAFVACMANSGPRILVNSCSTQATNNLLTLSALPGIDVDWSALALGSLSSLTRLSAELVGRSYGGGVLKLEPSEMARLSIPKIDAAIAKQIALEVEGLLRAGERDSATMIVDQALVRQGMFDRKDIQEFRTTALTLAWRRRPRKTMQPPPLVLEA